MDEKKITFFNNLGMILFFFLNIKDEKWKEINISII